MEEKRKRKFDLMSDQEYLFNKRFIDTIDESKILEE